jgi:hypothetical protein
VEYDKKWSDYLEILVMDDNVSEIIDISRIFATPNIIFNDKI